MNLDRDHAEQFLTRVYTGQPGLIQICSTGSWAGEFFPTTALGIRKAVDYAARLDERKPQGIYFRATTLKTHPGRDENGKPRRGGAADTLAIPFLWGDLDYGQDGHKGTTLPPTAEAARTLPALAGLDEPGLLIHSGGGWYPIYLTDQLTTDTAEAASVNLQQLFLAASQKNGWNYGTGVSDLARVLRLPGSINRKTDVERPCRVIASTGRKTDVLAFPVAEPVTTGPAATANVHPLPPRRDVDPNRDRGAFDIIDELCTWADILEPAGWTLVANETDAQRWLRPGGSTSEYSARAFQHNLVCHSESAGLPSGAGQRLTKGRVYAYLWYGGNCSTAARDLCRGVNTGSLPHHVIDDIRDNQQRDNLEDLIELAGGNTTFVPAGIDPATTEELDHFLGAYTRFDRPDRYGRRVVWMAEDDHNRVGVHARRMVEDVLAGHYPAHRALDALTTACHHRGGNPDTILAAALGAVLTQKAA